MRQFTRYAGPNLRRSDYRRGRARLCIFGLVLLVLALYAAYRIATQDSRPAPSPPAPVKPVQFRASPEMLPHDDLTVWA